MVKREIYLEKLRKLRDEQIIKLIVGVRGCGKSTVLELLKNELLEMGIDHRQVVLINFEEPEKFGTGYQWRPVYDRIVANLLPDKMNYVLLDEVQNVSQFERVLDELYVKKNVDLYVTGSNAWFLSPDIATLLLGRYTEIKMLPFSFKEYLVTCGGSASASSSAGASASANSSVSPHDSGLRQLFQDYMRFGAFPKAAELVCQGRDDLVCDYLTGLYNTAIVKDVMTHASLSNARAATNIMGFMLDNIGRAHSPKSVSEALATGHQAVSRPTVASYLDTLEQSFLLYPVERYDIKAQRVLQNMQKYYTADTGMMTAVLGAKAEADSDRVLENIVYLELLRRENIVRVGRTGEREIGFVATDKKGQTTYYQVVRSAGDDKLLHNELAALRKLDSNKCLLSLDPEVQNLDGIQQINIINWLLGQQPAVRSPQPIAKKPATRSRRNSSVRVRSSRWA